MNINEQTWKPGSFTKEFGWSINDTKDLFKLYETIKIGFDGRMEDVPRTDFRRRVKRQERLDDIRRIDLIPINFFLFNKKINGVDHIIADELVFHALTSDHSPRFDKLALFAFNFSYAGVWKGAEPEQRRPALWAFHYIRDRVAQELNWNTKLVTAKDIEQFVGSDPRYVAKTSRKLSTNLNYLYKIGRLAEFAESRVERWWIDSLFLALDRLIEDRTLKGLDTRESQYVEVLQDSDFQDIAGRRSLEKDLAEKHLLSLYTACGGRERFSPEDVKERTALKLPDRTWISPNDPRPQGAVHPTNPRILKSIPRVCAMLATYAGFDVIDADELANFDVEEFVRRRVHRALDKLREDGVSPTMSVEELMRLTRGR